MVSLPRDQSLGPCRLFRALSDESEDEWKIFEVIGNLRATSAYLGLNERHDATER